MIVGVTALLPTFITCLANSAPLVVLKLTAISYVRYHDTISLSATARDLSVYELLYLVPCHHTILDTLVNILVESAFVTPFVINDGDT